MNSWQVQQAKQRFSEVLRAVAAGEPQFITKHGETVAVVLDFSSYRELRYPKPSLAAFLLTGQESVGLDDELTLEPRYFESDRTPDFFEE